MKKKISRHIQEFVFFLLIVVGVALLLPLIFQSTENIVVEDYDEFSAAYSPIRESVEVQALSFSKEAFERSLEEKKKEEEKTQKEEPQTQEIEDDTHQLSQENHPPQEGATNQTPAETDSRQEASAQNGSGTSDIQGNQSSGGSGTGENEIPTEVVYFTTSIQDQERVSQAEYSFTIRQNEAVLQEYKLKAESVLVKINGISIPQFSGNVVLDHGKNTLEVSVRYQRENGDHFDVSKRYTVYYDEEIIYAIKTNAANETVYEPEYSFYATVEGAPHAKLFAMHESRPLKGEDGNYSTTLTLGVNHIYLVAKDDELGNLEKEVVIEYRRSQTPGDPSATPEDKKPTLISNLADGDVIQGSRFTLELLAKSYSGSHIYSDQINVTLNGQTVFFEWEDETATTYKLDLQKGENHLSIHLQDDEQYGEIFDLTVYSEQVTEGQQIGTATVQVEAGTVGQGVLLSNGAVPILYYEDHHGELASYVLMSALDGAGYAYNYTGGPNEGGSFYLARISGGIGATLDTIPRDLYDILVEKLGESVFTNGGHYGSLGEFDFTKGSGWMYSINGRYMNRALSEVRLTDGDLLRVRFTLWYGVDVGGSIDANYPNLDQEW